MATACSLPISPAADDITPKFRRAHPDRPLWPLAWKCHNSKLVGQRAFLISLYILSRRLGQWAHLAFPFFFGCPYASADFFNMSDWCVSAKKSLGLQNRWEAHGAGRVLILQGWQKERSSNLSWIAGETSGRVARNPILNFMDTSKCYGRG